MILPSDRERLSASEPATRLDGSMNRAESLPLSGSLQSKVLLLFSHKINNNYLIDGRTYLHLHFLQNAIVLFFKNI